MAEITITEIGATREEAMRLGLLMYWGEKPCQRHHIPTMRYTKGQQCVQCTVERNAEWRTADPERKVQTDKEYHSRPQVKQKQYAAIKTKRAADPQKRRDEENARYARNPVPWKRAAQKWSKGNGKSICRVRAARRRARVRGAPGDHTETDMIQILAEQDYKCAYFEWCRTYLPTRDDCDDDHIIAVGPTGSNDRTNMQCLCEPCNSSKGDKDEAEWMRWKWAVADPVAWRAARPPIIFTCDEPLSHSANHIGRNQHHD